MIEGYLVCAAVGILLFVMAYLIWKKKHLYLIAGYSEEAFKGDKEKLARTMGLFCAVIGLLTLFLPFGLDFIGDAAGIAFGAVVYLSAVFLVIYVQLLK
ncbi:DUF3784 domain-containing protein [Bacillus mangrovi]|uniref:DUF3784 domain-containing protein n=1 Tax=Metabacillus mangrovi TaxID=1491830 RepID=A0A7X2S6Y9_9BACI|nr:DUF3784 domain-containing protein [Metabacillus mangrovi]MTH54620.1 DUF3784 domain-containing protein [Metabacillus mangrovi]